MLTEAICGTRRQLSKTGKLLRPAFQVADLKTSGLCVLSWIADCVLWRVSDQCLSLIQFLLADSFKISLELNY